MAAGRVGLERTHEDHIAWLVSERNRRKYFNFLQLLLPLVAQLGCLGRPEPARGVCSLFPFLQSQPTDGENRYDVRQLLFHLDHGISWAGYLISPTFGEAIILSLVLFLSECLRNTWRNQRNI